MADMPAYKRADILLKTAAFLRERTEDLAKTITAKAGKALKVRPRRSGSRRAGSEDRFLRWPLVEEIAW